MEFVNLANSFDLGSPNPIGPYKGYLFNIFLGKRINKMNEKSFRPAFLA